MFNGCKVGLLVDEGFEDTELVETVRALNNAGVLVVVIGMSAGKIHRGRRGKARISVDVAADDVGVDELSGLIVAGGHAPDRMRLHEPMVSLLRRAHDLEKVIAAICYGPQLLISADIVRGRRVTSWASIAVDLVNAGATWVDEPVVQDGNIITARKASDLPRFNKAIINALSRK